MIKNDKKIIFLAGITSVMVFSFVLLSLPAVAQITDNLINFPTASGSGEFNITKLFGILNGLACWLIRFAIVSLGLMLVFYGLLFFKSRGTPQGMTEAKKALTWGIIGGLVIFGVFTIILSIANLVGVDYPITDILKCS